MKHKHLVDITILKTIFNMYLYSFFASRTLAVAVVKLSQWQCHEDSTINTAVPGAIGWISLLMKCFIIVILYTTFKPANLISNLWIFIWCGLYVAVPIIGRGFNSRSGRYQVVTTWMCDCLRTGKPSRYITVPKVNSAFHPSGVGKLSTGLHGWG